MRPTYNGTKARNGFPVMPGQLPFLGHAYRLRRDALHALREANADCGPLFWVYMLNLPVLLTLDESGIAILRNKYTDSSHLRKHFGFLDVEAMNLFDGPPHRRARSACSPAFTPQGLDRSRAGEAMAETMQQRMRDWPNQERLSILKRTKEIALEIIFRVMGIETNELEVWSRWYNELILGMNPIRINLPGFPAWRSQRAHKWLVERVSNVINNVRARGDRDSMIGAIVHGRDEEGKELSEKELIHNFLGFGLAGSDTTASLMAWTILHLAQDSEAWNRLCDETSSINQIPTSFKELQDKIPYAVALCRETLRLYPPAPLEMRFVHTEFELMGRKIPSNIIVGCSLLHISRNPERYSDPNHWQPERWLNLNRTLTPTDSCQFGGGPHTCLGQHLALLEGTIFIVHAARVLSGKGVVPRLIGGLPRPVYLPLLHPPINTRLELSKQGAPVT